MDPEALLFFGLVCLAVGIWGGRNIEKNHSILEFLIVGIAVSLGVIGTVVGALLLIVP